MKAILFDLDNTLYPAERDLFSLIDIRINHYMKEVVEIPGGEVDELRRRYWAEYGATLQGLIRHYQVDPEDYLDYVHDVDVTARLQPDPALRQAISQIPAECYVFTNGSRDHAERVITALGLNDLFAGIFDIRIAGYQPKPKLDPYQGVLRQLDAMGDDCVMIEDSLPNLQTAKQLGMTTVHVGSGNTDNWIDHQVPDATSAARLLQKRSHRTKD